MSIVDIIINSLQELANQLVTFVPKVVIAIFIWFIGKSIIKLLIRLVKKIDIKGTEIDNRIIDWLARIVLVLGKFFLILIILDYFGVGRTIINAIVSGLTFAVAITIGIAFGYALKPEARDLIDLLKKQIRK